MQKSGDGSPGSVNTIVVSTFTAVNGVAGASSAGINISASYVGCCTGGQMNWVQTLTTDSQPIGAETIPFPDALVKPPTQTPYYFGWPPGGSTWIPWDFMSNHTTTSP
jgi:hypothetical protein